MLDWIKKHPYLTGGLVLGAIVFYVIYQNVSGSNSAAAQAAAAANPDIPPNEAALDAAQIQAGAQTQAVNAQLQAATNQAQATQNIAQIQANAQTTAAQLASQDSLQQIVSSAAVQTNANQLAYQTVQAQVGGQVQLAQIQTQGQVDIAGSAAQVQIDSQNDALAQEQAIQQAAIAQQSITANAQVNLANIAANQNISLGQIQAGVQNNTINATEAVDIGQLQTQNLAITKGAAVQEQGNTLAAEVAQAQIHANTTTAGYQTQVLNNYISAQQNVADTQTKAQETTQNNVLTAASEGVFNKGGTGGANTVSAIETSLTGQNAPIAAPPTFGSTFASIASGIGSILGGAGSALFGGGVLAAGLNSGFNPGSSFLPVSSSNSLSSQNYNLGTSTNPGFSLTQIP